MDFAFWSTLCFLRLNRDHIGAHWTRNYSDMIPVSEPLLVGNELDYVRDCIATGWISSAGKYVTRFEQFWADYCGMKHGIAVSSGTAALQVAVDALRLEPG